MRISCPQCNAQYNVDEKRIPPQGVQIKCPKPNCGHAFVVQAPAADGGAVALPGSGGGGAVALPGSGGGGAVALPGSGGGGAVALPGSGGGGAVPLPGSGGGGAVALPGSGGGGAVALPGMGGGVPLPGGGGGVPLPGMGGGVPLPGGGGGVPLPGMGGGVPLPGGGGGVPLPGMGGGVPLPGGGGGVPLPGFGGGVPLPGGGGGVPLPGMGAGVPLPGGGGVPLPGFGGGAPLPGMGGGAPLPGFGGGAPLPGALGPGAQDAFGGAPPPVGGGLTENSVLHPFHGQTQARPAPAPPPTNSVSVGGGVLDFIDRAADQAGVSRSAATFRVRKRSGKVVGPYDEATVLKMLRSHELVGTEDASQDDGATWRPLNQFDAFAAEINAMMASALSGLGDLGLGGPAPAPRGGGGGSGMEDLPAPRGMGDADLPAPGRARTAVPAAQAGYDADLPTPMGMGMGQAAPAPGAAAEPGAAAPAKPARVIKAFGEKKLRVAPIIGGGVAVVILVVGGIMEVAMPQLGFMGRKKLFGDTKPVEKPVDQPSGMAPPPPKALAAVRWDGTTVEDQLAEDTLAGYQEARNQLASQLNGGPPPVLAANARALSLAAYLDRQQDLVVAALAAAEQAVGADARRGAPFKAFAQLADGKVEDALATVTPHAGTAAPETLEVPQDERAMASWANTAMAYALLEQKNLKDAIQRFDWALTAMPNNLVANLGQARALYANGNVEAAQGYLERGVAMQPETLRSRLLLGEVCLKQGKLRQAMEQFQHVAGAAGAKGSPQQRAAAHVGVADTAAAGKDFKLALDELKNATAEEPTNVALRIRHGEMALRMGDWPQARGVFDELLKADPAMEGAIIGSARAKLGATDALGAYQQLEAAVKAAPQSALLTHWFGEANNRMGKAREALDLYRKAHGLDPSRALPVVAQARMLMDNRGYAETLRLVEPAFGRVAPEEAHLLKAVVGEVHLRQRNHAAAFKAFEEVLAAAPQDAQTRAMLGRAFRETGKYEDAQKHLKQALQEDPRNPVILAEMGSYFESQGQYERAMDFFQQALAISPKEAEFHIRLGAATFRRGDSEGALGHLKTARDLAPNSPDVHYWMGLAIRKTDPDRAKSLFKSGMELAPEDARFDHEMARSVGAEGAAMEAVDYLRSAVRKDPKNGDAYYEMGRFLAEQTRYNDARDAFQRAADLMPGKGHVHLSIAETYERGGQYDQARKEYQLAMKKDPNLPEAHCKMGDVYRLDQKLSQAVGSYRTCVQLNPRHRTAWRWLGYALLGVGGKANQKEAIKVFKTHLKVAPDDPENSGVEDQLSDLGVTLEE